MPGLAVYASPENITKYKSDLNKPKEENQYSSPYVHRVSKSRSEILLCSCYYDVILQNIYKTKTPRIALPTFKQAL